MRLICPQSAIPKEAITLSSPGQFCLLGRKDYLPLYPPTPAFFVQNVALRSVWESQTLVQIG